MNLRLQCSLDPVAHSPIPSNLVSISSHHQWLTLLHKNYINFFQHKTQAKQHSSGHSLVVLSSKNDRWINLKLPQALAQFSTSSLLLLALGVFTISSYSKAPAVLAVSRRPPRLEERLEEALHAGSTSGQGNVENIEDEKLHEAFESWKSKTYALTVPLRVVALQGSVPPAWIKAFIQCQGKRAKLGVQFRGTLDSIYSELSKTFSKVEAALKSSQTADLVTMGDSWLDLAIGNAMIEPIYDAEEQDWFNGLTEKWKVYLRRNNEGKIDPEGKIWAVPYRWGSMVIAYKKSKFDKLGLAPIEDWSDLWQPELAGKISMIDSPREVVGSVLKYMGASYNTNDIRKEIPGGINAVQQNLALLAKQVLLFDNTSYIKAFSLGDTWVAVGWSSDILPAAKRLSNVAVVVPKSGASLWTDLWAIPATSRCPQAEKLGGRIRGPSPLIHQWIEFCLQPARALPFKQGVFPGASPSALENPPSDAFKDLPKGAPKLVTNLIAGIPPPEILAKCEFLEPLSETALSDYRWLISSMQKPGHGSFRQFFTSMFQAAWFKELLLKRGN